MAKVKQRAGRPTEDLENIRIPILGDLGARGSTASKDERYVNGYFRAKKHPVTGNLTYSFVKRPGLLALNRPAAANAVGRGVYSWNGSIFSVAGTKLYKGTTDLGVTLTTSTGLCGFAETRPGASTQYLGINDGVKLYIIDTSDVVITVTVNFPTPNTAHLVYQDGYWFALKSTGAFHNCDIDAPATWDATKILTAQGFSGTAYALVKQNSMLLVFLEESIQAFYNNANASGSPMTHYDSSIQNIGSKFSNTVVSDEGVVTFVGSSRTGNFSVYTLEGITNIKDIADDNVRLLLAAEGSTVSSSIGQNVRLGGKKFYILSLSTLSRTLVYDYGLQIWTEFEAAAGSAKWPIVSYAEHSDNTLIAQHASNGWLYTVSPSTYQDDSVNFTVLARFGRIDLETMQRKFTKGYELLGDKESSTASVSFQYSDDDYGTMSSARTFDMSTTRPFITCVGNFRRRVHQLSYAGNLPARWEALQLTYRLGEK